MGTVLTEAPPHVESEISHYLSVSQFVHDVTIVDDLNLTLTQREEVETIEIRSNVTVTDSADEVEVQSQFTIPEYLVVQLETDTLDDIFFNTACTLPSTPTSPDVGGWKNRIVGGPNAGQPTAGKWAKWQPNIRNGFGAIAYDGFDDWQRVLHTDDLSVQYGENFSIMTVVGCVDNSVLQFLAGKTAPGLLATAPGGNGWDIRYEGSGTKVTILTLRDANNNMIQTTIPANISEGSVYIISFVADWAGSVKAYLNGFLVAQTSMATLNAGLLGTGPLYIGCSGAELQAWYRYIFSFIFAKGAFSSAKHNELGQFYATRYNTSWNTL